LKGNKPVTFFVLLTMAIVFNGCASTKPVTKDAGDASSGKVDAAGERTDDSTEVKSDTFPDEAGASR